MLPWNCSVTGVSGVEMRLWPPAMLASCAIFTTSPPYENEKERRQLVKGCKKKKKRAE